MSTITATDKLEELNAAMIWVGIKMAKENLQERLGLHLRRSASAETLNKRKDLILKQPKDVI